MSPLREATVPRGAYGLRLDGLTSDALVAPIPPTWPSVRIARRRVDRDTPQRTRTDASVAELAFQGWALQVDSRLRSATFFLPKAVTDDEIVHPYVALAAVRFANALDRDALHAGAFVAGAGAWAVLAERGGGKSTTLAALARRGVPVLTDDALVVENGIALAGPRCIDLRPGNAWQFGADLDSVRRGERRRITLPPTEASAPLRGFFLLTWGERLELSQLSPSERLVALARHCRPETATRPTLLELARLPGWRVQRPPDPEGLDDLCGQLLATAHG